VHVGQLLDLQGALQAGGKVVAPAHDQERLLVVQLLGDLQDLAILLQNLLDLRPDFTTLVPHSLEVNVRPMGKLSLLLEERSGEQIVYRPLGISFPLVVKFRP
jgi:hypothetical protein